MFFADLAVYVENKDELVTVKISILKSMSKPIQATVYSFLANINSIIAVDSVVEFGPAKKHAIDGKEYTIWKFWRMILTILLVRLT